ncbi:hypothetical protein B296_00029802 [Ensete ventricosum]|uniref:Uncharacterized protein n=1 Tax=Ensete ventricosum TaxID=4639 RepID=A0A427AIS5_ENSVE|nr:hypothetical protein B296_00029802 [Ensete ventricosum]
MIIHRYNQELLGAPLQGMIRVAEELDYFSAHIRLREPDKSKDKVKLGKVSLYRIDETSVEPSISCSNGGRALVVKGVEEVKNVEANSKFQDKAEEQRSRNFIRPVSMGFSLR